MDKSLMKFPPKVHLTDPDAEQYAAANSLRLHPAQVDLINLTKCHPDGAIIGEACELQFFQLLMTAINAKKYLEIGTFTGYSALTAALALPPDGKVVTLDIHECLVNLGRPFWKQAEVDHKIETRIGDAKDTLDALIAEGQRETFDFIFIDADKENYDIYYEKSLQLVRKNGIIALDNVLWRGKVFSTCDSKPEEETQVLSELNRKLHKDDRIHVCMLTISDGVTFVVKK